MKIALLLILTITVTISAQEKLEGTAPNFELENLDGDIVELSEFLGQGPVLISFWATWCKPCVEELKAYEKIFKEYKEKFANPYVAASRGYVDEVIEPSETRSRLLHALDVSRDKVAYRPEKKHGIPPF